MKKVELKIFGLKFLEQNFDLKFLKKEILA
jgi:hypothetical protein